MAKEHAKTPEEKEKESQRGTPKDIKSHVSAKDAQQVEVEKTDKPK